MKTGSEAAAGRVFEVRAKSIPGIMVAVVLICALGSMAYAVQDRFTLKAPNGVAFSEFKGYETWQDIAVSEVDDGLKVILGNPVMMKAYRAGIPGNGKPFPEGSTTVKIEWTKVKNPASPYPVMVPGTLKTVSFIVKDSKRFPQSSGWGYAQFVYDAASDTFKPFGNSSAFAEVCYKCHTLVKAQDYIFTAYPRR